MRRLGSGGMAEVLEAEALGEAGFVRRVAIKRMLATANEDASFARMFLDEARIASRLHHANIVSVLDYGLVDGAPFQVLELVDGVDARTLVRRGEGGKLPVDIALYIVAQIGHALASAHEATDAAGEALGIVHRDVSPGNVLISWDGDVKLADFGIAFAKDKIEKTEAGTTKGTLIYMSPEQAVTGRVDRRADVFSLGCVLHTLLTGVSPLAGDHFVQFLSEQKLPISAGLPEDVHSIVEIATQYDREQRFQSAVAMTEAVGRALASRVERDPRRRLVEYLVPLRKKVPETVGRLDALLRIDIVIAHGAETTVREFHTAALDATATATGSVPIDVASALGAGAPGGGGVTPGAGGASHRAGAPAMHSAQAPTVRRMDATAPPSGRGAWIGGGAALIVLSGAAAAGMWWLARGRAPVSTAMTSASVSALPAPGPAPSALAAPSASVVNEVTSATEPVASVTRIATPARRPAAPARPITAASAAPSAAAASCRGAVYLSCPLAPRASIVIDGALTGLHHGDFTELACAAHTIAFDAGDGKRASRGASPTSANTRTSPLEVRCGLQ